MMTQAGTNGFDPTTVKRFLGEALRVYDKLDAAKIDHMNNCREIRSPLKDIKKAAKNAGLPKAAFNALIKSELAKKNYDRAIEAATPDDDEDIEAWEQMRAIAGDGDLFDAAVKKHDASSDDSDLRPRFLQEKDAEGEQVESNVRRLRSGITGLPGADAESA